METPKKLPHTPTLTKTNCKKKTQKDYLHLINSTKSYPGYHLDTWPENGAVSSRYHTVPESSEFSEYRCSC